MVSIFSRQSLLLLIIINILQVLAQNDCVPRDFGFGGTVCVCDSNHCDTIEPLTILQEGQYVMYTSNKEGLRFNKTIGTFSQIHTNNSGYVIKINSTIKYQTMFGFGGAFTDSFGINVKSLKGKLQEDLLKSYFSEEGIEYSLCRVPMGGTDFSTRPYTYDDFKGDISLEKFNLTFEDYNYKIPLMQQALSLRKGQLNFFASPWSAPAWMKTNDALSGLGFLCTKYYQLWADYYLKFLQDYEKENITFWGITTGNEPVDGLIPFIRINSMGWVPSLQTRWISENLGPTIRNSIYNNTKIMVLDDQRFFLPWLPKQLFMNNKTKNYVDGIAVHWYYDQFIPVSVIQATHNDFPEKFILATEACAGNKFYQKSVELGSWHRGEEYAQDIIDDINHWVTGWVDWNMALNEQGGPTYIDNFVDSPIIVNATAQEFYKNPMFYAMGHFSKFVPPKSVRIHTDVNTQKIKVTAVERPDKGIAIVILNSNSYNVKVKIHDNRRGTVETIVTKHSINSFIYW